MSHFDVFLSYHWRDHAQVEALAHRLREQKLTVFLDRWYLTPGQSWPKALETTLASCRAIAVCLGQGEMGPWQQRERDLAIQRQVEAEQRGLTLPVIPILLPGSEPPLGFLSQHTWIDFRDRIDDSVLLHTLVNAIHGNPPGPDAQDTVRETIATICPYRGLLYFREEDAPFFFGREAAITQLTNSVQQHSLVAVVGASGSGKSSVVRAGLIPALRKSHDQVWEVATIVPTDRPVHELAEVLMPLLEPNMTETDRLIEINKLIEALLNRTIKLREVVNRVLAKQPGTDRLLLIVDQWEELFTLCQDDATRRCFIDNILEATATTKFCVVLTLRGDFFGRAVTGYRALSDRLQGALVNLGPMTRAELEQAIVSPARGVVLSFADGLVTRILDDVGDEPGHLPLLEFVLKRLWEERHGPELSHQAYDAMGGLQGAVAQKAEELFGKLTLQEQDSVKRVFLHVVRAGETGEDTRRRATRSEIGSSAMDVVKKLVDERLLVTNRVEAEEETIEVSHEALIRQWQRVQEWLNEYREFLLWRDRLRVRVSERQHNLHDEGTLLHGAPRVEAERWLSHNGDILTDQEQDYIRASTAAHERDVQSKRQSAERELAQATRLAEEAAKREEAERARAEAADRARRRQRLYSLALIILLLVGLISTWLWQKGYTVDQALLRIQSVFGRISVREPQMVPIRGGTFQIGDVKNLGEARRSTVHPVAIKPFFMGKYEVTFDEYDRFAIATERRLPEDLGWGRGKQPVINVSWEDARAYAQWLSQKTGQGYRLPSESEWEYAARSGDPNQVWAGTSSESDLRHYAVFAENSGNRTAEVGTKEANGFGLYDLSGNVWEWVEDCAHSIREKSPRDRAVMGKDDKEECKLRVIRGGSWSLIPEYLRASYRFKCTSGLQSSHLGFRLAQDLEP